MREPSQTCSAVSKAQSSSMRQLEPRNRRSLMETVSRSVPEPCGETAALSRQMITLRMRTGVPSAPGPKHVNHNHNNNNKPV